MWLEPSGNHAYLVVGVVVARALRGALLVLLEALALLAHVLVEAVPAAALAERMARTADGLALHGLQPPLLQWIVVLSIFEIYSIGQ